MSSHNSRPHSLQSTYVPSSYCTFLKTGCNWLSFRFVPCRDGGGNEAVIRNANKKTRTAIDLEAGVGVHENNDQSSSCISRYVAGRSDGDDAADDDDSATHNELEDDKIHCARW